MKKSLLVFLLITISCISTSLKAQNFEVPANYKFETKEDYPKYEKEVLQAIDWLMDMPEGKEVSKRKEVSAFFMKWLMGSPYVMINIHPDIVSFMECQPCLTIFLAAWTKASIKNKALTELEGNIIGISAVIEYYQLNKKHLGKQKTIKKYIKLQKKGQLKADVENKLSSK